MTFSKSTGVDTVAVGFLLSGWYSGPTDWVGAILESDIVIVLFC